jgi:transposase
MYQNAGEKGIPHPDPADPPRKRANKARGHGNWETDRPPVCGVVGRESGKVWLSVERTNDSETCLRVVETASAGDAHLYSDDWSGYDAVARETWRTHTAVSHSGPRCTYALDLDGDGIREAHTNTMEGLWTSLRNFLRPFRGVSKYYLQQYVRVFAWGHNLKRITSEFLQAMVMKPCTG